MYVCRAAWQALAARLASVSSTATLLRKRAPLRQISSGSVPGSSGENLIYYLFAGVACTAGGYYAYRTVTSDKKRYNERIHAIQQSNTAEWKPKPWPPQRAEVCGPNPAEYARVLNFQLECDPTEVNGPTCMLKGDELETAEDTEASEQATEAPTEEAEALTADESTEQNERSMVSTEAEGEKESPVADASSAVEEAQQEATASLEAAQVQEVVGEDLDVAAASAPEDNIDSIQEGTASAAQEMPDTSSRNQEAVEDESGQDSEASSATMRSQEIPKNS